MGKDGRALGIAAIGVAALGWLLSWFLSNFLYSLFWGFLGRSGVREADLIAYILAHIAPFLLALLVMVGTYLSLRWQLRTSASAGSNLTAAASTTAPSVNSRARSRSWLGVVVAVLTGLIVIGGLAFEISLRPEVEPEVIRFIDPPQSVRRNADGSQRIFVRVPPELLKKPLREIRTNKHGR